MLRHLHNLVVVIVTGILSGTKHGHGPACGHYQDDSCLVLNRMMVRNFAGIEVSIYQFKTPPFKLERKKMYFIKICK